MQATLFRWLGLFAAGRGRLRAAAVLATLAAMSVGYAQGPAQPRRQARPSQGQAASQFLRAVLRADYAVAYARLAPEVRRGVSLAGFQSAARPLWKSGQPRRQQIELYKLGLRLDEGGGSQLFYSFSFAADSSLKTPPVLLEVTFRDTASRAVLGFGLRNNRTVAPKRVAKPLGGGRFP